MRAGSPRCSRQGCAPGAATHVGARRSARPWRDAAAHRRMPSAYHMRSTCACGVGWVGTLSLFIFKESASDGGAEGSGCGSSRREARWYVKLGGTLPEPNVGRMLVVRGDEQWSLIVASSN